MTSCHTFPTSRCCEPVPPVTGRRATLRHACLKSCPEPSASLPGEPAGISTLGSLRTPPPPRHLHLCFRLLSLLCPRPALSPASPICEAFEGRSAALGLRNGSGSASGQAENRPPAALCAVNSQQSVKRRLRTPWAMCLRGRAWICSSTRVARRKPSLPCRLSILAGSNGSNSIRDAHPAQQRRGRRRGWRAGVDRRRQHAALHTTHRRGCAVRRWQRAPLQTS